MSTDDQRPAPARAVRGSSTGRPIMVLLDLLGRRWALRVIWELHLVSSEPITFRALQERCQDMSSSVLNQRLAELRKARLVERRLGGYSLTDDGTDLVLLLAPLDKWAKNWTQDPERRP